MDRERWDAHVRARVFSGRPERAPFLSSTDCVRPRGFACPWLWEGAAVRECISSCNPAPHVVLLEAIQRSP